MPKQKFYAVIIGRRPGVYSTWDECKVHVDGFPGAVYKSYPDRRLAEMAVQTGPDSQTGRAPRVAHRTPAMKGALAVDAACSGNPGDMEFRGVWIDNGDILFEEGPIPNGTNNIAEFLALVYALRILHSKAGHIPIYTDSRNAMSWVKAGKARSHLPRNRHTEHVWRLVEEAEAWLAQNRFTNKIHKWDTEKHGEIPADYGRK